MRLNSLVLLGFCYHTVLYFVQPLYRGNVMEETVGFVMLLQAMKSFVNFVTSMFPHNGTTWCVFIDFAKA